MQSEIFSSQRPEPWLCACSVYLGLDGKEEEQEATLVPRCNGIYLSIVRRTSKGARLLLCQYCGLVSPDHSSREDTNKTEEREGTSSEFGVLIMSKFPRIYERPQVEEQE